MASALVVALYLAVALLRWDLVRNELEVGRALVVEGGRASFVFGAYAALLFGLLGFVAWIIGRGVEPRRDAVLAGSALLLGWGVEAWGTRTGIWAYYTGEVPPGWIVPAWALGALVVHRVAGPLRGRLRGAGAVALYWGVATLALALFIAFVAPTWHRPSTWIVFGVIAVALLFRSQPARDAPILAAGLACVFLADSWGTGSGCYRYLPEYGGPLSGRAAGVLFGMLFDTAIVLAACRLATTTRR